MKYLKYGYGRTTDHASQDIREGRITREEGIKLVKKYDHQRPEDLNVFLKEMNMTEDELMKIIEPFRDPNVWEKRGDGSWIKKVSVDKDNIISVDGVEEIEKRMNFIKNWKPEELDPKWYF